MEDESTITLRNLQLMIANLSLDNAKLQARVSVLSKRVQELEAAVSSKGGKHE
nr:MAG TPA: MbeD/MobD like [Caudoviricetes sp.]